MDIVDDDDRTASSQHENFWRRRPRYMNGLVRGLLSFSVACVSMFIHLNPNFRLFPFSDSPPQSFFDARREELQHALRHIGPMHVYITVSRG